jgi:DNA-binding transcriptional MerR regulator
MQADRPVSGWKTTPLRFLLWKARTSHTTPGGRQERLDLGACSKPYALRAMAELTVSRLAERVGMTPDGIRYYERAGLLPKADRTASGYRIYDDAMADRLRFIKGAQRIGLRLREIRELLDALDRGLCPCGHTETMLRERVREIDQEIARLRNLKRQLGGLMERFPADACEGEAGWPCHEEFVRNAKEATNGRS